MRRGVFALGFIMSLLVPAAGVSAGVNDFTISNFHADYYLSRDAEGRSTLKTEEQITAQFPSYDQNHGIERAIPSEYDGHSTSLKIISVTDGADAAWNYKTRQQGDLTVLRIGDADRYVQGTQVYKLTYTQRDVTKYFPDTNDDELYWDTNGTGWQQPFGALTATVHVDRQLASKLTGSSSCYQGSFGASERCTITRKDEADGAVSFNIAATRSLYAGENVTYAIGFEPHAFAEYQMSAAEKLWRLIIVIFVIALVVTGIVAVGLLIWLFVRYNSRKYRKKELGSIAVEYIPPKGRSVMAAAKTFPEVKGNVQSAQLVDLAVRHYIKIYQTSDKSLFSTATYDIELVKPTDNLSAEEQRFVKTLFGSKTRLALKDLKRDTSTPGKLRTDDKTLTTSIQSGSGALFEKRATESTWFTRLGVVSLVIGLLTLSPLMIIAAVTAFMLGKTFTRLTDDGLALERYLYGLRDYIKLAEADRLRMLQSPEGAEKVGASFNGKDPVQLVKLYERVLPYAVLFGEEKGWNELIGKLYEQADVQPSWYVGRAAFNAVVFSSAMSSFSSSVSSSSSSGGSSGGGSSGGGGGGGGGGGW